MKESCHEWLRYITCELLNISHRGFNDYIALWIQQFYYQYKFSQKVSNHFTFVCLHVHESCLARIGRVKYDWVTVRVSDSCRTFTVAILLLVSILFKRTCQIILHMCVCIWISHVTCEWVMSRMIEICHVWVNHTIYEWVISRMNESCHECHVWVSHVTYAYEWGMSRMIEICHVWVNYVIYEWVMSRMIESRHAWVSHITDEWVISHINMSRVSESCHARMRRRDESYHIWMGYVTYEWVMSHINESCPIWTSHVPHEWVVSHMNGFCYVWMILVTDGYNNRVANLSLVPYRVAKTHTMP